MFGLFGYDDTHKARILNHISSFQDCRPDDLKKHVFQLRAQSVRPQQEIPEAEDEQEEEDQQESRTLLVSGLYNLFHICKILAYAFQKTDAWVHRVSSGRMPKDTKWCIDASGKPDPDFKTVTMLKKVKLGDMWARQPSSLSSKLYLSMSGMLLELSIDGLAGAPMTGNTGRSSLPRLVQGQSELFVFDNDQLDQINSEFNANRQDKVGWAFSENASQEQVNRAYLRAWRQPLFCLDGSGSPNIRCIEWGDV